MGPRDLSEYAVVIAFPLQRWLSEQASMFCYTYIAVEALLQFNRRVYKSELIVQFIFRI